MNKPIINYFIDIGLGISFVLVAATGIMKFPGLVRTFRFVYNIIPAYYISRIHNLSGIIMTIFVLIHLILHLNWIVSMTKNIFNFKKTKKRKKLDD